MRVIIMNKKTDKQLNRMIEKRNNAAMKSSHVKTTLLKVDDKQQLDNLLSRCSCQNQVVDLLVKNASLRDEEIAQVLYVRSQTFEDARKRLSSLEASRDRVSRHALRDRERAIAKRAIAIVT